MTKPLPLGLSLEALRIAIDELLPSLRDEDYKRAPCLDKEREWQAKNLVMSPGSRQKIISALSSIMSLVKHYLDHEEPINLKLDAFRDVKALGEKWQLSDLYLDQKFSDKYAENDQDLGLEYMQKLSIGGILRDVLQGALSHSDSIENLTLLPFFEESSKELTDSIFSLLNKAKGLKKLKIEFAKDNYTTHINQAIEKLHPSHINNFEFLGPIDDRIMASLAKFPNLTSFNECDDNVQLQTRMNCDVRLTDKNWQEFDELCHESPGAFPNLRHLAKKLERAPVAFASEAEEDLPESEEEELVVIQEGQNPPTPEASGEEGFVLPALNAQRQPNSDEKELEENDATASIVQGLKLTLRQQRNGIRTLPNLSESSQANPESETRPSGRKLPSLPKANPNPKPRSSDSMQLEKDANPQNYLK